MRSGRDLLASALCVLAVAALNGFAAAPSAFLSAKPVWPAQRETEMNLTVGFRAVIEPPDAGSVHLRVAASTLYRVFINGAFRGHGPARAAHGYYRVDDWGITSNLHAGKNAVAIEVAGYNANSFYVLNQPSFLQAEVLTGSRVLASTMGEGVPFEARILKERTQKVERYTFQRTFVEIYKLEPDFECWRKDPLFRFEVVPCRPTAAKRLLPRGVPYPDFALRQPERRVSEGSIRVNERPPNPWRNQYIATLGSNLRAYPEAEQQEIPSLDMQRIGTVETKPLDELYPARSSLAVKPGSYQILDFGTDLTGFIGATVTAKTASTLYLTFDEMLVNGDVDFKRLSAVNVITYHLAPGKYNLETFEPYTLRYVKAIVTEGDCDIENIHLREYANPDVWQAQFASSDEGLNRLFAAGRETYRQNAVDIFTDCPSRERGGWLCDSYFTARVEHALSGHSRVERNFLENFLLPGSFDNVPDGMLPQCYPCDTFLGYINNWALWFVLQLEEYSERTGDRQLVNALKPRVMRLFDYFRKYRNEDGLIENPPGAVFVEWSAANSFTKDVNYPTNMLYASALAATGRMYGLKEYVDEAGRIRELIRKQSFDGEFFVDNAERKDGKLTSTRNRTETCQYYAFYLETATPEKYPQLWDILQTKFGPGRKEKGLYPEIHPSNAFIGNMLRLELLSRYGLAAQWMSESRGYLLYMAERTGTLWENVDAAASLNHGFASHVVHSLYRDVLGLHRVDWPGKSVTVRFNDLPLDWCEGRVPVPGGAVSLRWARKGGNLEYQLDAPAGYAINVENQTGLNLVRAGNQ